MRINVNITNNFSILYGSNHKKFFLDNAASIESLLREEKDLSALCLYRINSYGVICIFSRVKGIVAGGIINVMDMKNILLKKYQLSARCTRLVFTNKLQFKSQQYVTELKILCICYFYQLLCVDNVELKIKFIIFHFKKLD